VSGRRVLIGEVEGFTAEEVQFAARNHGMPLEALRYDVTPVGLHYLLIHYDIPAADADGWRLRVAGAVENELDLSIADLKERPRISMAVTLECAGNGRALLDPRPISQPWLHEAVGNAEWTGTPLRSLLEGSGIADGAADVVFTGADHGLEGDQEQDYERSLPLGEAMRDDVFLAYEMNGQPLPPQHGFPLRLVVPGWYGMTSVKWLRRITVVTERFAGFQNAERYRVRSDPEESGEPVTRMLPRSLMVPPGFPEFSTRTRIVDPGRVTLTGRAWSGFGAVERVEVSTDGGSTWADAPLGTPPSSRWAWRAWTSRWDATPGEHVLCSRATDESGRTQLLEPAWNVFGYQNNAVQLTPVLVRG
jgi:DMSO/TMAO reductase YedYZ molybdopterin-dependent catalytic subunit